jgi:hypothetical protein
MSLHEFYVINKCITLTFQCIIFGAVLLGGYIKVFHPHSGIWMYCKWGLEKHERKCALNVAVLRQGILCTEVAILWGVIECYAAFLNFTEYEAHNFKNSINSLSFFLSFFIFFFLSLYLSFLFISFFHIHVYFVAWITEPGNSPHLLFLIHFAFKI